MCRLKCPDCKLHIKPFSSKDAQLDECFDCGRAQLMSYFGTKVGGGNYCYFQGGNMQYENVNGVLVYHMQGGKVLVGGKYYPSKLFSLMGTGVHLVAKYPPPCFPALRPHYLLCYCVCSVRHGSYQDTVPVHVAVVVALLAVVVGGC